MIDIQEVVPAVAIGIGVVEVVLRPVEEEEEERGRVERDDRLG